MIIEIEQTPKRARDLFSSGFYCAESVFMALAEKQGIQSDLIPRIATGFCSGIARTGGQCGAVSGAILGIGLAAGRRNITDPVDETYTLTRDLIQGFTERFGSVVCPQLLACDINTPEGQASYRERHLFDSCLDYVEEATRIALSLLAHR